MLPPTLRQLKDVRPPALTPPALAAAPFSSTSPVAIRLDHVSFTYADGAIPALRDISLEVQQGEMIVILGASGAGKSTLVKCFNRVIPAFQPGHFSGAIHLFGRRLLTEKVGELAGTIGMVFQDFEAQVFSTSVRDEVVFGMEQIGIAPAEMQRRLSEVLAQVGLAGFESRDPATLSGGEKQRLAIAAILALRPRLLVLDEPTTDLDPQGRQEIFALLRQMRTQGHTLVVVEHEIAAATEADRLVVLANGQIVAMGPPDQILPRIETLTHAGVRPHDFDRLFQTLAIKHYPRDVEGAAQVLRTRGVSLAAHTCGSDRSTLPCTSSPAQQLSSPAESAPPLLHLAAVSHQYAGARSPAIAEITLTITAGEFIALLGANGSGKTTLAKHCSGLLTPTQGQVFLHGQELRTVPLAHLAQKVGYVFQNPDHQLFAATVEEEVAFGLRNLGLPPTEVRARVSEVLETVGLCEVRERDPFLLDKGERQRLAVAAVLALRPQLLILRDPFWTGDGNQTQHLSRHQRAVSVHHTGRRMYLRFLPHRVTLSYRVRHHSSFPSRAAAARGSLDRHPGSTLSGLGSAAGTPVATAPPLCFGVDPGLYGRPATCGPYGDCVRGARL